MNIVVVDDEMRALRVFLDEIIDVPDVEYKFFKDNADAVCLYVARKPVDAAFLDIRMPDVDGIALAARLLDAAPTLKIVFITGLAVTERDLPERIRAHTVGFLYKPYDADTLKKYLALIGDKKRTLHAKMFDTFDCFLDGKAVAFSSAKSKELFALLLAYNGRMLTMTDAISQLWPDANVENSKILYRDAVWRLRKTLNDAGIPCVRSGRAVLTLDKSYVACDYWDFLVTGKGDYRGEFCKAYDWSIYYLERLDKIATSCK